MIKNKKQNIESTFIIMDHRHMFPRTVLGYFCMEFKDWLWRITHPTEYREMQEDIANIKITITPIREKQKNKKGKK